MQKQILVAWGLNLFYCNIITMGLGTSSKTYIALSLYNNWHTIFYMQIKYYTCVRVYNYKYSKWYAIKFQIAHFDTNVNAYSKSFDFFPIKIWTKENKLLEQIFPFISSHDSGHAYFSWMKKERKNQCRCQTPETNWNHTSIGLSFSIPGNGTKCYFI